MANTQKLSESGQGDEKADRWLAQWRRFDFSWHGLAHANWTGGADEEALLKRWRAPRDFPGEGELVGEADKAYRQSSLQEYWRWSFGFEGLVPDGPERLLTDEELYDAGLLVQRGGMLWHILYRPETQLTDAIAREDEAVMNLTRALKVRMRASGEDTDHADHRVQLVGSRAQQVHLCWRPLARSRGAKGGRTLGLRGEMAEFRDCNASSIRFAPTSSLAKAQFSGSSDFGGATFGENMSFEQAVFGPMTDFYDATFRNGPSFERAVFGEEAFFQGARFGNDTSFRHVRFGEVTDFGQASFGTNADFRGCDLGKETSFNSATFLSGAEFRRTRFGEQVSFAHAQLADATIEEARLERTQILNFESVDLSRAHIRSVNFNDTDTIWSGATLDDAEFARIHYDQRRLRRRCAGLKGADSIWGDALLRRDMQDQDYVDTLEARLDASKPDLVARPAAGEKLLESVQRHWDNLKIVLAPDAPRRIWIAMIVSAMLGGLLAASIMSGTFADIMRALTGGQPAPRARQLVSMTAFLAVFGLILTPLAALLVNSWYGRRAMFVLWALLGFGRDWDRVALLALVLIGAFGFIYLGVRDTHVSFGCASWVEGQGCQANGPGGSHWFMPWFVAAMGFATLGIGDFAEPITGLGQLIMISNVLCGFTIFGLLLAVLGNRFARRS